jgi:hypothetical protein
MARRRLSEPGAVTLVILAAEEDGLALVAALDHMQGLVGQKIPAEPRHPTPSRLYRDRRIARTAKIHLTPISPVLSCSCRQKWQRSGKPAAIPRRNKP